MERGKITAQEQYEILFPGNREKAEAFDKIAERYYFSNFGSTSKSDIELMMFSIYLERILAATENEPSTYSDYTLSKYLGITQSRIASMKERKELRFPRKDFDWKEAFQRCISKVTYDGDKIQIYITDRNVYLEVKNAIEENGGFVWKTLTPNLLTVSPEYYVDLMMTIRGANDRNQLLSELKKELAQKNEDTEYLNQKSISELIKESGADLAIDAVTELLHIQFLSGGVKDLTHDLMDWIGNARKQRSKRKADIGYKEK